LQRIVDASGGSYSSSEINPSSDVGAGMAGLFGDEPVLSAPPEKDDESKDEEDEKSNVEIIPY